MTTTIDVDKKNQQKLARKIRKTYQDHYPHGKFYKTIDGFFCHTTKQKLDMDAMNWLEENGYVRLHFGTLFNFSFYILDDCPHGLIQ